MATECQGSAWIARNFVDDNGLMLGIALPRSSAIIAGGAAGSVSFAYEVGPLKSEGCRRQELYSARNACGSVANTEPRSSNGSCDLLQTTKRIDLPNGEPQQRRSRATFPRRSSLVAHFPGHSRRDARASVSHTRASLRLRNCARVAAQQTRLGSCAWPAATPRMPNDCPPACNRAVPHDNPRNTRAGAQSSSPFVVVEDDRYTGSIARVSRESPVGGC